MGNEGEVLILDGQDGKVWVNDHRVTFERSKMSAWGRNVSPVYFVPLTAVSLARGTLRVHVAGRPAPRMSTGDPHAVDLRRGQKEQAVAFAEAVRARCGGDTATPVVTTTTTGVSFGAGIQPRNGHEVLAKIASVLSPDELPQLVLKAPRSNYIVVTNERLLAWEGARGGRLLADFADDTPVEAVVDFTSNAVTITGGEQHLVFDRFRQADLSPLARALESLAQAGRPVKVQRVAFTVRQTPQKASPSQHWTSATIVGGRLTKKASDAIARQCLSDDLPGWMAAVGNVLPLTHGIQAAREVAAGGALADVTGLVLRELGVGAVFVVIGLSMLSALERLSRSRATLDLV